MKNNSVIFSCIFLVSFSLFHVLQAHSAEQSSDVVKADTKRLKHKIQSITKSIKIKENQRSSLQKKIFSFDGKIEKLGRSLYKLVDKQAAIQTRLDGLGQEKEALQSDIESSNQAMAQLIKAFYLIQTNSKTKSLINRENIAEKDRMKVYHDYLIKEYLSIYQSLTRQLSEF